jgi:hypothetical protein
VAPKIDANELGEIVEETARIQAREADALEPEQARAVLREVGLPPERLEEAQAAVALKRARERERSTRLKLAAVVAALLVTAFAVVGWRAHTHRDALASITTSQAVINSGGVPLSGKALRSAQPELELDAVLGHAPHAEGLELECDWLGPGGDVRYQNHWQTQAIDKDTWPTHCRHRFGPVDPAGRWWVRMRLGERVLAREMFELE